MGSPQMFPPKGLNLEISKVFYSVLLYVHLHPYRMQSATVVKGSLINVHFNSSENKALLLSGVI